MPGRRSSGAASPRFDGDPVFCALLRNADDYGFSAIELADCERTEQHYLENTAILVTRLHDCHGGGIEITDFAPRFGQYGRMFRPMMLVRRIRRLGGSPRLTLRVRPACNDGTARPEVTWGSNHIRYVTQGLTLRLTTDASLTAILQETAFFLEDTVTLLLGADESVHEAANEVGRRFLAETTEYWSEWVRFLGIPLRVAGSGDTRRDHAQTQRLRRHRRHRRCHDHLDSRSGRQRTQLGLPLLLGTRRLFRGERPESAGRHAHHGTLPRLHRQCCRQRRRRCAATRVRHRRAGRAGRKGSPRHWPAIAAWARCASATWPTARCSTMSMVRSFLRRRTSSSTSA
jgi:hypothetical protein